ncbi:hypothetical protein OKW43_006821 [Paraburkholderia sp. WC7.3g]
MQDGDLRHAGSRRHRVTIRSIAVLRAPRACHAKCACKDTNRHADQQTRGMRQETYHLHSFKDPINSFKALSCTCNLTSRCATLASKTSTNEVERRREACYQTFVGTRSLLALNGQHFAAGELPAIAVSRSRYRGRPTSRLCIARRRAVVGRLLPDTVALIRTLRHHSVLARSNGRFGGGTVACRRFAAWLPRHPSRRLTSGGLLLALAEGREPPHFNESLR